MDYLDAIQEIRKHVETLNKEGGETRDCLSEFKTQNANEHGKINSDLDWIKKFLWCIFVPMLLLVIKAAIDYIK